VRFYLKQQDGTAPIFFQDLGENTCSLQPAFNSKHTRLSRPGLHLAYTHRRKVE